MRENEVKKNKKPKLSFDTIEFSPNYEEGECSSSHPHPPCVVCLDGKYEDLVTNKAGEEGCGHIYCSSCIVGYIAEKMKHVLFPIMCPVNGCSEMLVRPLCQGMLPCDVYERWKLACIEALVLATPVWIICPFEDCSGSFRDDGKNFLIRACPNCWKIFCMRCRVAWHLGITCEEYQRIKTGASTTRSSQLP